MVDFERSQAEILLPKAIATAVEWADISIAALNGRIDDLRQLEAARRDGLTGLWRPEHWEKLVEPQIEKIQLYGPESGDGTANAGLLVILDTEDLHFINNELGLLTGDQAIKDSADSLRELADSLRNNTRTYERRQNPSRTGTFREHDLLCRSGGDEFIGFFQLHIGLGDNLEEIAEMITSRFKGTSKMPIISLGYTFILPGETKTLTDYKDEAEPKARMTDAEKAERKRRKEIRQITGSY